MHATARTPIQSDPRDGDDLAAYCIAYYAGSSARSPVLAYLEAGHCVAELELWKR